MVFNSDGIDVRISEYVMIATFPILVLISMYMVAVFVKDQVSSKSSAQSKLSSKSEESSENPSSESDTNPTST